MDNDFGGNVDEKNIVGSTTGVTSSRDLFDIKEEFKFVVDEAENEKQSLFV